MTDLYIEEQVQQQIQQEDDDYYDKQEQQEDDDNDDDYYYEEEIEVYEYYYEYSICIKEMCFFLLMHAMVAGKLASLVLESLEPLKDSDTGTMEEVFYKFKMWIIVPLGIPIGMARFIFVVYNEEAQTMWNIVLSVIDQCFLQHNKIQRNLW